MKSITKSAGLQLYSNAEELLQDSHENWRCIQLNLSENAVCSQAVMKHFVKDAVEQLLAGIEGSIYFCEDNDVVILFQGSLSKVIKRLARHFAELNTARTDHPEGSLFRFYDLGLQWKDFFQMARKKYLISELTFDEDDRRYTYFTHVMRPAGI